MRMLFAVIVLCFTAQPTLGANVLWFPLSYQLDSNCGFGCYTGHNGTDYPCGEGTNIYASISGRVITVVNNIEGQDCDKGFGNYVKIQSDALSLQTIDAHMLKNSVVVHVEDVVTAGQYLGKSSNSGYTMGMTSKCGDGGGYHLHLEVRKLVDGTWTPVDPYSKNNFLWTSPLLYGGGTPPPPPSSPPSSRNPSHRAVHTFRVKR